MIVLFIGLRGIEGNNLFMRKLTRVNTCETSKHFHFTRILVLDPNGIFSLYFLMFSTFKFLNVTNTTLVKAPNALQWFVLLVLLICLTLKSEILFLQILYPRPVASFSVSFYPVLILFLASFFIRVLLCGQKGFESSCY